MAASIGMIPSLWPPEKAGCAHLTSSGVLSPLQALPAFIRGKVAFSYRQLAAD